MRIALLGTRGIPARYGGFETFAEELSSRLAARGHQVTVYTRTHVARRDLEQHRGARIRVLPALRLKSFETLSHTLLSCLDVRRRNFDVILMCNAANAPLLPILHARGFTVALNVDGLERKRRKWGWIGRRYYLLCERLSSKWADSLVTDAEVIRRYYRKTWRRASIMIPYGGDLEPPEGTAVLENLGLRPNGYVLYVSRFEPENNPDRVIDAYRLVEGTIPLVMLGDAPYAPELARRVRARAATDPRVVLAGGLYGEPYRELLFHARAYVHATEVGGTHPALVEAMGAARVVFYLDNGPNREVVGRAGVPFQFTGPANLGARLQEFLGAEGDPLGLGAAARARVMEHYRWDDVATAYERVLEELCSRNRRN